MPESKHHTPGLAKLRTLARDHGLMVYRRSLDFTQPADQLPLYDVVRRSRPVGRSRHAHTVVKSGTYQDVRQFLHEAALTPTQRQQSAGWHWARDKAANRRARIGDEQARKRQRQEINRRYREANSPTAEERRREAWRAAMHEAGPCD